VAITHNEDESQAVLEGLELIEAKSMIKQDDVVVITPNWVKKMLPPSGVVVGNETLKTLLKYIKSCQPKRIVVASGSGGGDTKEVMKNGGFDEVLAEEGIEFIDLNEGPFITMELNHQRPHSTKLNRIFQEMTVLISFTQLKIHEEATISGAIKNIALSWPPSSEHGTPKKNTGIHDNLHDFIVAMAEVMPIDLSVVSANPVMVGTGPAKGIARHTGFVITGTDAVSVDTVGARFLGFKPQAVRYLFEAGRRGIGQNDILKMNLYGIPLIQAEKAFSQSVYGCEASVDAD
jgi:uncharacterized protein (DUF362 family)